MSMASPPQTQLDQPGITPVRRYKVCDSVAAQIEEMVRSHVYAIGDRLPSERVLAEEFGVGRSSMREAFRVLEARGIVRIVHGVGVFIASEGSAEVRDWMDLGEDCTVPELFEIRFALECDAAALAARKITATKARSLQELLRRAEREGISREEFIQLDQELHREIIRATRNRLYVRFYESIQHLFVLYAERALRLPGRQEAAHAGHAAIVGAIVSKRAQAARSAMRNHLRAVEQDINAHLAESERDKSSEV